MVRPKPTIPAPPQDLTGDDSADTAATEDAPQASAPTTTGWLRRSLNLGKKVEAPRPEETTASNVPEQETQVMSLFDIEDAKAVAKDKPTRRAQPGIRFVLKFDDGTNLTVGDHSGIMGVKPLSEKDEFMRLCLDDPTDTVAPEHCEFGVDDGVFWVKDLKTINGTVVEEPGSPLLQCIPYEKYSVVRGSRVGLGSLFFVLH
jgi:hypothetical protein